MGSDAIEKTSGRLQQKPPVALTPETESRVQAIGEAEILVGIPSYNNADTIAHVVRAVSVGLAKYFPGR
ncbi:MAG: hypothetical protein OEY21_09365, partial [Nitrospira sp.]|nr:hypothetical protein [Nitrospira sp.]